ncbi:DAR GTPase 2, mitochondrial isoform X1 [Eucalyptus grandis]|uniref:DAR GTPase 2, mitochondrial isoform X1 n=1 Tax=Eucalyptus grandis TaxID=71139 RepID=UPI00192EF949|nr:DAR GTPase 2, mitochondrial isoform X1 [Eucalyptus grandis]
MEAAATAALVKRIGTVIKRASKNRASAWWYSPHMAAASRAIAERLPLADLIVEVRDARVPLSSEYELLKNCPSPSRRIVVLNKMDLANSSRTKEWMRYFELQNCESFAVNSHNRENIKQFLNFLQAKVRELKKMDNSSSTTAIMLVGIPNTGKSALANSLHNIGRISAAEKGKLKHAAVSSQPCETKDISSLKIASNPNVYVLDTPGVLPPVICDFETSSKLALIGTIRDSLAGEKQLAQFFLSILDSGKEYEQWAKLSTAGSGRLSVDFREEYSGSCETETTKKRQYPSDHTQDFIVQDVRRVLYESISSTRVDMRRRKDVLRLIEFQLAALREAFRIPSELGEEDACIRVSEKLLNLYRTGRLGHFTLDDIPKDIDVHGTS